MSHRFKAHFRPKIHPQMRLVCVKTFVVICRLLLVVSHQSSTTIPAATPNDTPISGDLFSDAKYKFPQNELAWFKIIMSVINKLFIYLATVLKIVKLPDL